MTVPMEGSNEITYYKIFVSVCDSFQVIMMDVLAVPDTSLRATPTHMGRSIYDLWTTLS